MCPPFRHTGHTDAAAFHATLPGYAPTPLVEVPTLAVELGVGRVLVKDESARLHLGAFKVLGASWAIHRLLARHLTGLPDGAALVAATDGNHGRAVAWTARLLGLPAHVYVPHVVPARSVEAIRGEGAAVTIVTGSYDDAVRRAAGHPGGVLVQDTSWPGYEDVPRWIVDGYATLFAEVDAQLSGGHADLVVVPMGVGSLAQAAITHHDGRATALLGVEPDSAACVLASLRAGRPTTVSTGATIMAGLNCGTPSAAAWPLLRDGLDAAVAVTDAATALAVRDLAAVGVDSGPSGAASLAGARAALTGHPDRRAALAVDAGSTVVLLNTEGTSG